MKAGAGWPMGPFALIDLVGIDVHVHAAEALYESSASRAWRRRRASCDAKAGLLGRKAGRGFYTYELPRVGRRPLTVLYTHLIGVHALCR